MPSSAKRLSAPAGDLQRLLTEREIGYTTALEPRLTPGSIAFIPAPSDAAHRGFLTYAWVDDPLKDLLVRLKGARRAADKA